MLRRSRLPRSALASILLIVLGLGMVLLSGCGSQYKLMPTPSAYAGDGASPFAEVPTALQTDEVSVLFITDRAQAATQTGGVVYRHERSRSKAFGDAVVRFGKEMSWDDIVDASQTSRRSRNITLKVIETNEIARFDQTPPRLVLTDVQLAAGHGPEYSAEHFEAERVFREELSRRLALTPRKEVFIYVHGFNTTFEQAVMTTAELWHFLGREGVPISYTWPAGVGVFRAYEYTVSSTEFTIYHFKQALRLIASCPEVEKIHIVAHSRGTAVTMNTLRELHLETRGTADTREVLKMGTVVLAAADIDLDVTIARDATERVGRAVEQVVYYISDRDKALGFSSWLSSGLRMGRIDFDLFEPEEIETLRGSRRNQFIDARVRKLGSFGHSYFLSNPAVSSDVVLLLRYQLPPGSQGRPLGVSDKGLWVIGDDYPGAEWSLPVEGGNP